MFEPKKDVKVPGCGDGITGKQEKEVILLHLTPRRTSLINWLFNCVLSFHCFSTRIPNLIRGCFVKDSKAESFRAGTMGDSLL